MNGSEGVQVSNIHGSKPPERSSSLGLPRRFYKGVRLASRDDGRGYDILLDGLRAKTLGKWPLSLPSRALAAAVAREWRMQGERIDLKTMPLTRLASIAIDQVSAERNAVIESILSYAGTDMLLYRTERMDSLRKRQEALWNPILAWVEETLGVSMPVTAGIMPIDVPKEKLERVRLFLGKVEDFPLSGIAEITRITGSAFLALALFARLLTLEEAWTAAHVDEDWQRLHWGVDKTAEQVRGRLHLEMDAVLFFLGCCSCMTGGGARGGVMPVDIPAR